MRFTFTFGLLVSSLVMADVADAAPRRYYRYRERGRGYDSRHQGLFLRGALGIGGVSADDDLNEVTLSGGAGLLSLDIGGGIAPNLALHGRFSHTSIFEPNVTSDGVNIGDLDDTSLTFSLLGLGLTYYTASNVYFTGVLGLSRATFEFNGDDYDALDGLGLLGEIGYEWQLAGDLGLGLGGRIELHRVRGDAEILSMAGLGVMLSLTYF